MYKKNQIICIFCLCILISFAFLSTSCSSQKSVTNIERESLFSLEYGVMENELNLFNLENMSPSLKTRIVMRDGIFFVSNGNAGKVLTLSSFGDFLSMIYNPEMNPQPQVLQYSESGEKIQGRFAKQYPFVSPGEIGVDSKKTIYVEDKVPERRISYDNENMAKLDSVVLCFSRDGEYMDYIGQEGMGGTPFPPLHSLHITQEDEVVVISVALSGWLIFRYDANGLFLNEMLIKRDELPFPDSENGSIASMDNISVVPDGSSIAVKVDYFHEIIDAETKTQVGIEFSSSYVWFMDAKTGFFTDYVEIPSFSKRNDAESTVKSPWSMVGTTANEIFFTTADENSDTYYVIFNRKTKTMKQYFLSITPDELLYTTYSLSPEGILSGLLASQYEAKFVWWRFDKLISNTSKK